MHIGIKEIAIFEHLQLYMDRDCNYNIKQEKGTCLTGTEVYRTRMKEIDQMNVSYMSALFTAFLCWGTQYVMSKIALQTLPPVTLLLVRYAVAVPTLFLLLIFRRKLKPLQRKDVKMVAAIGFTGYFFSFCVITNFTTESRNPIMCICNYFPKNISTNMRHIHKHNLLISTTRNKSFKYKLTSIKFIFS